MQKFFIVTAFVLLSSVSAAAQTPAEQNPLSENKVEFANRAEASSVSAPVISAKGRQTERVVDGRVIRVGPTTTYLKNGLSVEEVFKLLGRPAAQYERLEAGRLLTIYAFPRSAGRLLIAQFENGLLTDSRMETQENFER